MGTGSYGGGGGGGGGAGGGGRFPRSGAEYYSEDGELVGGAASLGAVRRSVSRVFESLPREYVRGYVQSPLMRAIYEALFRVGVELGQNHSWQGIRKHYSVDPGPACSSRLAAAIISSAPEETNEKVHETALTALDDFLVRMVGDDIEVFFNGDAETILRHLDPLVFGSTSGHFLTFILWRVLEREHERLPPQGQAQLKRVAEEISNRVIDVYRRRFITTGKYTYRQLLDVLATDPDWFRDELRRDEARQ